jgi:hypothetical protein
VSPQKQNHCSALRAPSCNCTPPTNTGWLTGQRGARGARWYARIGLSLSCWLAFTLFNFRDHTYFLRLTRGFTWELNYTQFFTFESTRNSPALQLLGSHYPRVRKKLQSAKCPSNIVRTKFATCLHKASDWFLLDSWEFLDCMRSLV